MGQDTKIKMYKLQKMNFTIGMAKKTQPKCQKEDKGDKRDLHSSVIVRKIIIFFLLKGN